MSLVIRKALTSGGACCAGRALFRFSFPRDLSEEWLGGDGVGPCPVDRAKTGIKRSILCDGSGLPLSVVVAAANVSDSTLVRDTLAKSVLHAKVMERKPLLLLDRGYYGPRVKKDVEDMGYQYQVPPRPKDDPYYRLEKESARFDNQRRVVVENCHAWLQQWRGRLRSEPHGPKERRYQAFPFGRGERIPDSNRNSTR